MFDSILVVCVGNICRSPTGERLLKNNLPGKKISSAGIAALEGEPADSMATIVALENGLSLEGHLARQITSAMCHSSDLILVMETAQINVVCRVAPEVRGKIMLFGHWNGKKDIVNPYRKSREAYEFVYRLLEESALQWSVALSNSLSRENP